MTAAGYNMRGDLDICAREEDHTKFMAQVKKLAMTRNVTQRTIMLWCYLRSENTEMANRLKNWIQEYDNSKVELMDLPVYELATATTEE